MEKAKTDGNNRSKMAKQKRVSYDNAFKISVIEYAEKFSNCKAERMFGCSEKLVRDWRKIKDKILNGPKGQKRQVNRRVSTNNTLESDLITWLQALRQSEKKITRNAIIIKAQQLAKDVKYGIDAGKFKPSVRWCDGFMNRHGFHIRPRSHIVQGSGKLKEEDKQDMETGVDDNIVETEVYQTGKSDSSVTGDEDVTFDIYLEDTEMKVTDENKENVECDEAECDQDIISEPKNTASLIIETMPKNLAFSETVLNEPILTESGNADEEVRKTPADPEPTSNKMVTNATGTFKTEVTETLDNSKNVLFNEEAGSGVDNDFEGVANVQNQSDNNSSLKNQSGNRKSVASLDDIVGVEIKQEPLYSTDEVRVAVDEVYHITMLVSGEQEDAIRLLFRNKNWQCWLKVLSGENIAGLNEGGYKDIFPSMESEEGMETNDFTVIKSQVVCLDDIDDVHRDNQSWNAVEDRKSNEDYEIKDYEMTKELHEKMTESSFNIVKTERNENDEMEDTDSSINGESREDTYETLNEQSSSINGQTSNETYGTINGESRDDESSKKSKTRFHCGLCDTHCTTNIMLKKHFEHHPNGFWLDFYCKDCFERFKTREELWKHRKSVKHTRCKNLASKTLNTPEELVAMGHIKCEVCNKFYSHKRSMRQHMFAEHKDVVPKYQCGVCGEDFDIRDELWQHMRETKHRTSISQLGHYQCDTCGKICNRYDSFKEHKKICCTSKDLKNIPCDICGMLFHSKIRLNGHKRRVHVVSPQVCDICGYTCKNKSALLVHKYRHDPKNRRFKCDDCSKSFYNKTLLIEHKRTHTKEKPFKCPICIYRCAIKQNMHKHVRNVHKTKLME